MIPSLPGAQEEEARRDLGIKILFEGRARATTPEDKAALDSAMRSRSIYGDE